MEIFKRFINIEIGYQETFSLEDGEKLSEKYIASNIDDIIDGTAKIRFLIPAERLPPNPDGRNNLKSEFFSGFFEPLLIAIRDEYISDLKHTGKRDIFSIVKDKKTRSALDAFVSISQTIAETCNPIEDIFWDRIQFGMYDNNAVIRMGKIDSDREFYFYDGNIEETNKLFFWVDKACKSLDGCFAANLEIEKFRDMHESNQDDAFNNDKI